ncbi:hypothetical protein WOLCODRAFT_64438, partial [Wolfiporia cocos MD-104 SS10]
MSRIRNLLHLSFVRDRLRGERASRDDTAFSSHASAETRSERKDQRIDDAFTAAKLAVETMGKFVGLSAHAPGVDGVMSTLGRVLDMVMKARDNDEEAQEVVDAVASLADTVKRAISTSSEHIGHSSQTDSSGDQATAIKDSSLLKKAFRSDQNVTVLRSIKFRLDNAFDNFQVCPHCEYRSFIVSEIMNLRRRVPLYQTLIMEYTWLIMTDIFISESEKFLDMLSHKDQAEYGSPINVAKSGYLPGTRVEVLQMLEDWATDEGQQASIFILSGAAGTGKSTIAYELAKRLDDKGLLGASFFFVRGDADLSSIAYVFPTIAYQLAQSQPHMRSHIIRACRDPSFHTHVHDIEHQLDHGIINPLKSVSEHPYPVVVIVDALDECTDPELERIPGMLHLLANRLRSLAYPLRVLLTTRPELHIERAFESLEFAHSAKPYRLHTISRTIVDEDIKHFFSARLSLLPQFNQVLTLRPTVIDDLTKSADGLFIYASTVIRSIVREESEPMRIAKFMDDLLSVDNQVTLSELDNLYLVVLAGALPSSFLKQRKSDRSLALSILGAIALLQDHLDESSMRSLLSISQGNIKFILSKLGSVILYSPGTDQPIRPLHASFPQFLIDPLRCINPDYYIS